MLTLCLSLLLLITNNSNNSQITDKKEKVMKFELIQLPYAANALEPVIGCSRIETDSGIRCVGTCLLFGLPEPPSRSFERFMENHRLGYRWQKILKLFKLQIKAARQHTGRLFYLQYDWNSSNIVIFPIIREKCPITEWNK